MADSSHQTSDEKDKGSPTERRTPGWLLGLVGFTLVTVIGLVVIEAVLRLAGVGYHTKFFISDRVGGEKYIRENPAFFWRFMGKDLARTPLPIRIPVRKSENSFRILILGESAALGDPQPAFGFPQFLEVLLADRFPQIDFEIVNTATTAIDTSVIVEIAREAHKVDADLWLFYGGNNEFMGPAGPGSVFNFAGSGKTRNVGLWLRNFRLAQAMDQLATNARQKSNEDSEDPENKWGGMSMFSEMRIPLDKSIRDRVVNQFAENLNEIVRFGERAGVPVILVPAAVNLSGCGPFASMSRQSDWISRAEKLFRAGDYNELRQLCESRLESNPDCADTHYFLGVSLVGSNDVGVALKNDALNFLEAACSLDMLPFRTTKAMVDAAMNSVGSGTVVRLNPGRGLSGNSLGLDPGLENFFEHVHLTPEGNYRLAMSLASEISEYFQWPRVGEKWMTFEECRQAMALTPYDQRRMILDMLSRLDEEPLSQRPGNFFNRQALLKNLEPLTPALLGESTRMYESIEARGGEGWMFHQRFAIFLDETGNHEKALDHLDTALMEVRHSPVLHYQRGIVLQKLKKIDDARMAFQSALEYRASFAEARLQLAWIDWRAGNRDAGLQGFVEAIRLDPLKPSSHLAHLVALKMTGSQKSYLSKLESVVRRFGESTEVQIEFLSAMDDPELGPQIANWLDEASTSENGNPALSLGIGRQLRKTGNTDKAAEYFKRVLEVDELNPLAHYQLGLIAIGDENLPTAISHLARVVQVKPDFYAARFNLGVALARAGDYDAAYQALAGIPESDPNFQQARKYMDQLNLSGGTGQEKK